MDTIQKERRNLYEKIHSRGVVTVGLFHLVVQQLCYEYHRS